MRTSTRVTTPDDSLHAPELAAPEGTVPPASESVAPSGPGAAPERWGPQPFRGFFEREESRRDRRRFNRKVIVGSVALHVVVFALLALMAFWRVEELYGPSVQVKLFRTVRAPAVAAPAIAAPPVAAPGPGAPPAAPAR